MRAVVAIPLFAAICLATPIEAAQDPQPREDRIENRRRAVSRPEAAERSSEAPPARRRPADRQNRAEGAGRAERAERAERVEQPRAAEPTRAVRTAVAREESRQERSDESRVVSSADRQATGGYTRGRVINPRGPVRAAPAPRVAVPVVPSRPVWNSYSYRRPYGSGYYPARYYAPAHYHNWVRSTYRWSPIAYAPWSLIYGSVGLVNFGVSFGGYYGPGFYANIGYGPYYAGAGYAPGYYAYPPYPPYGYYGQAYPPPVAAPYQSHPDMGGVRLEIRPRDAQVFVNGYYAGIVDDFDGNFQELRLDQGGHKIEVRMPGFEPLQVDLHIQPGRTITIREDLRPAP